MSKKKSKSVTTDYDSHDSTAFINSNKPLRFEDLGLTLPPTTPTQVVSLRLPTGLLNKIKAIGSQSDVPYQALIKLFLANAVKKHSFR